MLVGLFLYLIKFKCFCVCSFKVQLNVDMANLQWNVPLHMHTYWTNNEPQILHEMHLHQKKAFASVRYIFHKFLTNNTTSWYFTQGSFIEFQIALRYINFY